MTVARQQLVEIAKWLLRDSDILFFDEPTRGVDVGAKAEIYRMLQQLAEGGKAIVVISSELEEVLRLSHRIVVMCEGRVTGELDGRTATQEEIMTLAMQRRDGGLEGAGWGSESGPAKGGLKGDVMATDATLDQGSPARPGFFTIAALQKVVANDGLLAGSITQNPVGIGQRVVDSLAKAVKGETLPKVIDTGFYSYDKTNMSDPKIAAVLYD